MKRADQLAVDRVDYHHRLPVGCWFSGVDKQRHHRTALASLATLVTSFGWPREVKATRQSLGSHTSRRGIRFLILEVGREEVPLACFASRVQVGANLNLLRTSSSIPGAKAKNLTLRRPMNNSHVADPAKRPILYQRKPPRSEPIQPMKGTGEKIAARKERRGRGRGGAEVPKAARLQQKYICPVHGLF
jgi:hypothetical protein